MVVLKERPTPLQLIAMAVASLGVLNEVVRFGAVPWLGLALFTANMVLRRRG
jgi:EamA domain-containing membrane protein RarD